jgi:peptidoglycan/LPS O-acetylase OafA/YrhL
MGQGLSSDTSPKHHNNFDLLRLIGALLVFYSHSKPQYNLPEPLLINSDVHEPINYGTLGVSIFFAISGYLVTQSWFRSDNSKQFAKKRLLRIYPGMIASFLVVSLLIGSVMTELPLGEYLINLIIMLPDFVLGIIVFYMPNLPGVFSHSSSHGAVNISLWTLLYEFFCYFLIWLFGFKLNLHKSLPIMLVLFLLVFFEHIFLPGTSFYWLKYLHIATFMLGGCFYLWQGKIPMNHLLGIASAAILLSLFIFNIYCLPAYLLTVTYLVFYIALKLPHFGNVAKYGDFSYGVYLYSFPLEQSFAELYHWNIPLYPFYFASSLATTFAFAAFSWHVVEKQALKLKHR